MPKVRAIAGTDRLSRRRILKAGRFLWYFKIFAGLAAILGLLYFLFLTSALEIQNIDVKGEADTSQEQTAIKAELQQYLGDNLLMFDVSGQEKALLSKYGYLKTLDIDRDFFHTISVTVETYPPVANVRIEFENNTSQYYVINEHGFIASIGTNLENLPMIVMDVTGTNMDIPMAEESPVEPVEAPVEAVDTMPDEINEELIPEDVLKTLLETADSFEGKFDMEVLEIAYLKRARELHLFTERYFSVWIDLTQDVPLQLAKLKKALTEIDIYGAPLEYIDLRISGQNGEKVIYKLGTPE